MPAYECPRCEDVDELSDARECGVEFSEPLCESCRAILISELTECRDE